MVRLGRSMMERYEIADRRPKTLRAVLFGLEPLMLCSAARLLDRVNESGGDFGAVCVSGSDEVRELRAQDGMFTLLVRGELEDGSSFREERVVQSVLEVAEPGEGLSYMERPEIDLLFLNLGSAYEDIEEDTLVLTRFLRARWDAKLPAPRVVFLEDAPVPGAAAELRNGIADFVKKSGNAEFAAWLLNVPFQSLLVDSLFGELSDVEFAKARREMNYQDRFLLWAEPQLKCFSEAALPDGLAAVCETENFVLACERKYRIFDSLVFLCAAVGFLSGKDFFSQVLRDEALRKFIGHAFFDELLPSLPWPREEISAYIIASFSRLENSLIEAPLLRAHLMSDFRRSLLPSIRAYASREFEAPSRLSLALSAAIMIYAGARENHRGEYEVLRGKDSFVLRDIPDYLDVFSRLSHDMPAETLAYAVLADRSLWGEDLRDIDGLELRVTMDISSIQRVGFRETLRLRGLL